VTSPFFGKYRGVVTDNNDPMMLGRVRARVPDVTGSAESGWAMPCAPSGGKSTGFFAVPSTGAGVWIEFEHGDPDYPIRSGCWWGGQSEMPSKLLSPPPPSKKLMLITEGGHSVLLDDTAGSGGITLQTSGGAKIVLGDQGIEIDNGKGGKVKLSGSQVSINDGALEVS
jgi:uncharacterized protein involved in type VI secretion and phage assembly